MWSRPAPVYSISIFSGQGIVEPTATVPQPTDVGLTCREAIGLAVGEAVRGGVGLGGVEGTGSLGKVPFCSPVITDFPATPSARVNPVTVMTSAATVSSTTAAIRTRPVSPACFVENVAVTTGRTAAPTNVPHWPEPAKLVNTVPTTDPATASSRAFTAEPGACWTSCRSDRRDCSG